MSSTVYTVKSLLFRPLTLGRSVSRTSTFYKCSHRRQRSASEAWTLGQLLSSRSLAASSYPPPRHPRSTAVCNSSWSMSKITNCYTPGFLILVNSPRILKL